jgi:hypothetical protein
VERRAGSPAKAPGRNGFSFLQSQPKADQPLANPRRSKSLGAVHGPTRVGPVETVDFTIEPDLKGTD